MTAVSTLGRYMTGRFLLAILTVFALCLVLIFFIDMIEMLRQATRHEVSAAEIAMVTLLRLPSFAELTLPFAVLIGSIGAFLMLSRSSELVIIRAAGLSVWQFVQPGVVVALIIGLFAVAVYNPLAAVAKAESERLFATLFSEERNLLKASGEGAWLRQDGADGPSVIYARAVADRGATLGSVTVLQFDLNGKFLERIEARKAALRRGYWELDAANVSSPGNVPQPYNKYIVSTFLNIDQINQNIGAADSISFWELPEFIEYAERAGLSSTSYKLQYQMLLSRPFLMVCMVLVAATCSLRAFRFGRIQTMVIAGLSAGFSFFILAELSRKLGASEIISAAVAAWGPIAIASLFALTVLLHQEDG